MAELVACPECKKHLQVPDELLGKKVQCPECKHTFIADAMDPEEAKFTTSTTTSKSLVPKTPAREKSSSDPGKKGKRRADDEDVDDYDDEDDDRPIRRRSSVRRGDFVPHRGGMILAFGIIALVAGHIACVPFIFGPIAWYMGNGDLRDIHEGRMDPEGEGLTQAGRILGMVASILMILYVLGICAYFVFVVVILGIVIGANANKNFPPPRKF